MIAAQAQVEVREVTFTEISARASGEWCRLLLEESTGRVQLISSWGTYSYRWTSIGNQTLPAFLAQCDWHYLASKFLGTDAYVFDQPETAVGLMEWICRARRSGDLSKDQAREEWDLASQLRRGDISWEGWGSSTSLCDPWEFGKRIPNPQWVRFWEVLWEPLVRPALKEMHRST